MSIEEAAFLETGAALTDDAVSQMFGKRCFKIGGKAFVSFFEDCMVFKLTGDDHAAALGLAGAKLFDPSGKGRPMKEWVQVPFEHSARWDALGTSARDYVAKT